MEGSGGSIYRCLGSETKGEQGDGGTVPLFPLVTPTVKLIKIGQKAGIFRKGNADTMARCFWASVQGIMEEMSADKEMKTPDPEWIVSMLRA